MNNINRRRYVLSFRSFTYFCILLFLIIFSFLLYFNKNNLIKTSKNIIQSFSENFQYQFTKYDISGLENIELKFVFFCLIFLCFMTFMGYLFFSVNNFSSRGFIPKTLRRIFFILGTCAYPFCCSLKPRHMVLF